MPFTFKPDISKDAPVGVAPQTTMGTASTMEVAVRGHEGKSIIGIILMAALGISVLIALFLAGYNYYLSSQIEDKKAMLAADEKKLGTLPLDDMRVLSKRIKVINQLVNMHPSVNTAFLIVEHSIENPVTYSQFSLHYNGGSKSYSLSLAGMAPSYKAIAQQYDTFAREPFKNYIGAVTVDGLQPDETGKVGFRLSMPIKIAGLLPEEVNLSQGAAALVASTTPVTPATGTSSPENATGTPSQ